MWRGATKISQHTSESEAVERATTDYEATGNALYTLKYPNKDIDLSRLTRVIRDVDATRPNTPANLTGTPVSETQINLSWSAATDAAGVATEAVSGVVGYRLYRNGTLRVDQAGLTFNDTALTAYTTYSYRVSSYDAAGNESVQATAITPRTLDTTAPSAPVIAATQAGQASISVALTTPSTDSGSGVSTYRLEYKRTADSTWTLDSASLTSASFPRLITGLSASTQYDTRCRATDVSGNVGNFSATSQATTQAGSSNPIDAARRVDWTYAGATITNRTTRSGSVIAAGATITTINNAIAACPVGQYVELGAGTFNLASVPVAKSGVTLRGQGMSTILNFTNDTGSQWPWLNSCVLPIMGTFSGYGDGTPATESVPSGQTRTWTGTNGSAGVYARGATVLNLSSAGPPVGSYVVMYQANDPDASLPRTGFFASDKNSGDAICWQGTTDDHGQSMTFRAKVTAVSGTQITISIPLPHGLFTSANNPQVGWSQASHFISDFGIENLRIVTTAMGTQHTVLGFFHAHNCWAKGVGIVPKFTSFHAGGAVDFVVAMIDSFQCEVRDSWIGPCRGGGFFTTTSYALAAKASPHCKFENIVLDNPESACVPQIGSMGVVFSNVWERYVGDNSQESGFQPHESGQAYVLFEHCSLRKMWGDLFHGPSMLGTVYRCHFYGYGASLDSYYRFWNFVGNTITASTVRKSIVTDASKISRFGGYAFRFGYASENANGAASNGGDSGNGLVQPDPSVASTALLWDNYDTLSNAFVSNSAEVPTADAFFPNAVPAVSTPSSMLYSSAPSFYSVGSLGTVPWPPIGPGVSGGQFHGGRAYKLPAQVAYEGASGNIANFNPAIYGTTGSSGNTINAASASRTDVLAAIALASPGDTVVVPAGTVSWSGNVTISGITLRGPGKNSASPTTVTAGRVIVNKHASANTKLQGFRFTGTDAHLTVGGSVSNRPFLVIDNYFNIAETNHGISIETNGGVIAENDFIGPLSLLQTGGNSIASTLGATGAANSEWAAAPTFGTSDTDGTKNVYVEDNTITNLRDGWDCDDGSKMVFRHNTLNDSSIITHGGGSGSSGNDTSTYGCRQLEIYENTFNRVRTGASDGPINRWVWFRGSSGVVANNVMAEANSSPNWTSGQQVLLSVGCNTGPYPRRYQTGQSTQVESSSPPNPILISGNTGFGVPSNEIDLQGNPNNACGNPGGYIQLGRDYVTSNTWGWSPYTYPHPLRA